MDSMAFLRFDDERDLFEREIDEHYSRPLLDISPWRQELHEACAQHPLWSAFQRKIPGYRLIAERCPVRVFRHCPFFFELNTGRPRTDLGYAGIGCWMKQEPAGKALVDAGVNWWRPCVAAGLSEGWAVVDDNHHSVDYRKVLTVGLRGIIHEAESQLTSVGSADQRDFLLAAIEGNKALIRIGERFAAEAKRLAGQEDDPAVRQRLERMAATAARVPAGPAATFHEALSAILFVFHLIPALESSGVSVLGHLDLLLAPYYAHDLKTGRTTREEARDLIARFLAVSDARFGMRKAGPFHVGTNTTVVIGGCDRDGKPVFNDVTRIILEAHRALKLVDPKLNARLSRAHPAKYVTLLAEWAAGGGNALSVFNDEVIIAANVKAGKALADARRYVAGGCQENVLENCEISSRATIYLNAVQVFLMGFFPENWALFAHRDGLALGRYEMCGTYEEFHRVFLDNLQAVVGMHVDQRNRTEGRIRDYNPCPLHSSLLDDCLARRTDMMEGGCRYSPGSVSLVGIGTLVDSLYAVKIAVYERRMLRLDHLRDMLKSNFAGEDVVRGVLQHRIAKYGQEEDGVHAFSARVFADVAAASSGRVNTRGGKYEASLFSFRSFTTLRNATGATPDGRLAGDYLSAGMSPSLLALGHRASVGQVLAALEPLDLTIYPVAAVLDVKLPAVRGRLPAYAIVPVILRFLDAGGSVLQMNIVDQAMLEEARLHPELHPDLVVRVSGYSAYFSDLSALIQDEIIERTVTV